MIRRTALIAISILLTSSMVNVAAVGETAGFLQTHYYILPLGEIDTDVQTVTQATQANGFTALLYDGNDVSVRRAGELADLPAEAVYADLNLLIVDADRFSLAAGAGTYSYVVRPSEFGYELVVSPLQDIDDVATLVAIVTDLQFMEVLGSDVTIDLSQLASFERDSLKGPPPPVGVAIDSTLYALTIAEDRSEHASTHDLRIVGLRVEVVAEKVPGGSLAERFDPYVISETEQLAKLVLPIDLLLPLAKSLNVGYVRPPYQPAIP